MSAGDREFDTSEASISEIASRLDIKMELVNEATGERILITPRSSDRRSQAADRTNKGNKPQDDGAVSRIGVGVGWFVYLYMSKADFEFFMGLSYTVASAAFCFIMASTIIGAIGCAGVFYVVWAFGTWLRAVMGSFGNYCLEMKFTYIGSFNGAKFVDQGHC